MGIQDGKEEVRFLTRAQDRWRWMTDPTNKRRRKLISPELIQQYTSDGWQCKEVKCTS